jgi:transposase
MKTQNQFKPYEPNQLLLLPPDMKQWLPQDDLAYFIMEIINALDLSVIYQAYNNDKGGQPPFNPTMMTSLLLYAYCIGIPSSRKIEKATYYQVPFRVITTDQHPDHDTIADFRRRHLKVLAGLFVQALKLCQKAGLVKLGHISLDGTKIKANASKHKAMSYGRMEKKAQELEIDVKNLLEQAQAADDAEDAQYGKGKRGDELPDELRFKQNRLKKIKEAMQALEAEAKQQAEIERAQMRKKQQLLEDEGKKPRGKKPKQPSDRPQDKAQRNFTDPESRIMKDGSSKSFEQCYNCQAGVDEQSQVIVATNVTQEPNDKQQVKPMVGKIKENMEGKVPQKASADSGYFSEDNVKYLEQEGIDGYIATGRQKHGEKVEPASRGGIPANMSLQDRMARKLRTKRGRAVYSKRKKIVEPVFGQIKEGRGFRRFLLRGIEKVSCEWDIICMTHNILKLFRSGLNIKMS